MMYNETASLTVSGKTAGARFGATLERIPHSMCPFSAKIACRKHCATAIIHKRSSASAKMAAAIARRDQLVSEHLPLVKAIAVGLHHSLPVHVDVDDLIQAGNLGLLRAASNYCSERHVVFSGYAKHRIKGAILDSLRQMDWASRDMRRRHKRWRRPHDR